MDAGTINGEDAHFDHRLQVLPENYRLKEKITQMKKSILILVLLMVVFGSFTATEAVSAAPCRSAISIAIRYLASTYGIGPRDPLFSQVIMSVWWATMQGGALYTRDTCVQGYATLVTNFVEGRLPR